MSSSLQGLNTIKPMDQVDKAAGNDPVRQEYENGKRFVEQGEWGQAAVSLHNALVGFEEKNDKAGIANTSNQLGQVCLARQEYQNSLSHFNRALEICQELGDLMSVLHVQKQLISTYSGLQQWAQAVDTCLEVIEVYQQNRDPQGTVASLEILAEVYLQQGDKAKAADSYQTIAAIHKNFKHASIAESYLEKARQVVAS